MNAVFVGQDGVFDGLDTFNHYRELGEVADPGENVPVDEGGNRAGEGFGYACAGAAVITGLES